MATKTVIDEDMVIKSMRMLGIAVRDFYSRPCESTLILLIIYLYEVVVIVYSYRYSNTKLANWCYVKDKLVGSHANKLLDLRNNLSHNFQKVENICEHVESALLVFGKDDFKIIEDELFSYDIGLYEDILSYCKEGIVGE